ncbi:patatin-like protein 3 [Sorghum bicolor]|uniref:Patatin n=1 Tax=Sorghum bicolor TaxID=4558 RepID=C5Y821_SORBI|nr:patatin-like protein 3 [Sorghum bicolor]EES10271.2 hypothetical protein SORBI_3005G219000 [Sorghum bicolor]|eukprot:XP_021316741.1 patatin-like protein 3 [Sorghum bicolor]
MPVYVCGCSYSGWWFDNIREKVMDMWKKIKGGPQYNGEFLHDKINKLIKDTKLADTLSNVVIPAFDVSRMQPVVFNSLEAERDAGKNARLADVCIATSAAPTYLPAHSFRTIDANGCPHQYEVVDGGVVANNPTMVAMSVLTKEVMRIRSQLKNRAVPIMEGELVGDMDLNLNLNNPTVAAMEALEMSKELGTAAAEDASVYSNILVLSIGTGTANPNKAEKYTAAECNKWGPLGWVMNDGAHPIIDFYSQGSDDMVDVCAEMLFDVLGCQNNFLRIQADMLEGDLLLMDCATDDNMKALIEVGSKVLEQKVAKVNLETGLYEHVPDGPTNDKALEEFAKKLSQERKMRACK